jgi:hypothetical protein
MNQPKIGTMSKLKPLTDEQRLRIYRKALDLYKKNNDRILANGWHNECDGMCASLDAAMDLLQISRNSRTRYIEKVNFPEYYSYKPKTCWKPNHTYWITRKFNRGGDTKRIAILTACAEGKSKS